MTWEFFNVCVSHFIIASPYQRCRSRRHSTVITIARVIIKSIKLEPNTVACAFIRSLIRKLHFIFHRILTFSAFHDAPDCAVKRRNKCVILHGASKYYLMCIAAVTHQNTPHTLCIMCVNIYYYVLLWAWFMCMGCDMTDTMSKK